MLNSAPRHVKTGHYAAPAAHRRNNGAAANNNNNNKEADRFLTTKGGLWARAINRIRMFIGPSKYARLRHSLPVTLGSCLRVPVLYNGLLQCRVIIQPLLARYHKFVLPGTVHINNSMRKDASRRFANDGVAYPRLSCKVGKL